MKKIWNESTLPAEALKYTKRGIFRKKGSGAYQAACGLGKEFLDKICSHMEPSASEAYTDEEIRQEALKYTRKGDFAKSSISVYNAAWRKGPAYLESVCSHMPKRSKKPKNPTGPYVYWTHEMIYKEALKYNSKDEFRKNSRNAYCTAKKRGILKEIQSHMEVVKIEWTNEMLSKEAAKYLTLGEFQRKHPVAYTISLRRGILYRISGHMESAEGNYSFPESDLLDAIKSVFPNAKKLRDRSIEIIGKPHICGFDIDIFIPELNKGIEFDGKYWHGVEGLKRGRPHWPEDDIRNYHEIKDAWFATKGIQILHIKWEEWNKDRIGCIERCLNFLIEYI